MADEAADVATDDRIMAGMLLRASIMAAADDELLLDVPSVVGCTVQAPRKSAGRIRNVDSFFIVRCKKNKNRDSIPHMSSITAARWLLIIGIAFVFLYFGIDKFIHPLVWIGWMPVWMDGLGGLDKTVWLQIVGGTEIFVGALVLIPIRMIQKVAALLAALHLAGVLTQVGWNDIAVRDVGLIFMTLSLWYLL
jgi:hypothetical protein